VDGWIKAHDLSIMHILHITDAPRRGIFHHATATSKPNRRVLRIQSGVDTNPFRISTVLPLIFRIYFFSIRVGEYWDTFVECARTVSFQILTHSP
jgi:hypothetical protein